MANKEQTEIYYTKFLKEPTLFKYNIYTGKKKRVLSSPGMLIVSDVKKDKLLLTLAINDQPDIYEFDINSRKLKRITKFSGVDVNGHFYDNNKIVFISDRLGYPNVYQKDLETGMISKLIHHGKNHISVSTNGDNVVVSSRETDKAFEKNSFNLLLINKNSDFVKRLTFSGKNMQPIKYIIVTDEYKKDEIYKPLIWAAHLKDWNQSEDEKPSAYILVINDTKIDTFGSCSAGSI